MHDWILLKYIMIYQFLWIRNHTRKFFLNLKYDKIQYNNNVKEILYIYISDFY